MNKWDPKSVVIEDSEPLCVDLCFFFFLVPNNYIAVSLKTR